MNGVEFGRKYRVLASFMFSFWVERESGSFPFLGQRYLAAKQAFLNCRKAQAVLPVGF